MFRRLYRIFAHAYFEHASTFFTLEGRSHLYGRFLQTGMERHLLSGDVVIIPAEAQLMLNPTPPLASVEEISQDAESNDGSDENSNSSYFSFSSEEEN